MIIENLVGKRFGRLVVTGRAENQSGRTMWNCLCDCKAEKSVRVDHLRSGRTVSCGCHRIDKAKERKTHGMAKTRPYRIWRNMINRCYFENHLDREYYGGRGIEVCERWRKSFADFISDMGVPDDLHSLDRIDPNGNYEPANCRWATSKEQANNRRFHGNRYRKNGVLHGSILVAA